MDERIGDVRRIVAERLPAESAGPIAPLGSGLDHAAFLAGNDLVVRLAIEDDGTMRREAELLRAVAGVSPVAVPEPLFAEDNVMAYRLLPGVPLLDLPHADRDRLAVPVARTVGAVLAALWAIPAARAAELADRDEASPAEWRDEVERRAGQIGDALPAGARPGVEAFLGAPVPRDTELFVLSHNDLGIEHVLVDPAAGRVTGIIDWSDAALVDPAKDLGLILRDLGPDALDAALETSGVDAPDVRERAAFYARCFTLEDLAYGLEHGLPAYVEKSLDALPRLF
jgi:aminoglycoside phosphotransferase (APT) family kinase protein